MICYTAVLVILILVVTVLTVTGALPNDQPFYEYWLDQQDGE